MDTATDDHCPLLADVDALVRDCQHRHLQAAQGPRQGCARLVQSCTRFNRLLEEGVRIGDRLCNVGKLLPRMKLEVEGKAVELLPFLRDAVIIWRDCLVLQLDESVVCRLWLVALLDEGLRVDKPVANI